MRIADTQSVSIVGAGMAGTLLALFLARRGLRVDLYEKRPRSGPGRAPSLEPADAALGERARHALRRAGLLNSIDRMATPMRGRLIHDRAGELTLQPYSPGGSLALYSTPRQRLREALLDAALDTGRLRVHYGHRLEAVDWSARTATFSVTHEAQTASGLRAPFEVLIGADGPASRVRREMEKCTGEVSENAVLDAGYKQFSIPSGEATSDRMDRAALHIWPRGGYMMLAFPGPDGGFAALLFLPREGDQRMPWGFRELDSPVRRRAFMAANFPDAAPLMPAMEAEFSDGPVGLMGTVRCPRWHCAGSALLIGDAAHAVVPFHGQGVNAAFEDCEALLDLMETGHEDWESLFRSFQEARKQNTDALAEMSLEAYQTVRESVRHRDFLLRKAVERELQRRHPERFEARYSLVMFRRVPYAEAWRRGQVQAEILDELLRGRHNLSEVDMDRAARLICERLP